MSKYETILVDNHDDGVTAVTINRPERRNALSATVVKELQKAFIEFDQDDSRKVAVITGDDKAFSAGADIDEWPELWRGIPTLGFDTDKPIIGAVSGWCVGG